jgi:hypothetical protein
MPVDQARKEELLRKLRPDSLKTSHCYVCRDNVDPKVHVCSPQNLAEYAEITERWADPWKEQREEQQTAVHSKLTPILCKYIMDAEQINQLMAEIIGAVTPHLNVGGPVG